ncbi:MAG: F0F1 ATP synthase subunit A [Phycisphaerae bacterium]
MTTFFLASGDPMDHVLPHRFGESLFHWNVHWTSPFNIVTITPHDTYFTNHILMTIVAAFVLLAVFPRLGRRYAMALGRPPEQTVPTGLTNLLESVLQFIRDSVVRPVLGDRTDRFMPFLWTLFFFILTCNLLGLIPLDAIIGSVSGGRLQHIGGTATGNIMITAGLAACSFFMIHFAGARQVYSDLVAGTYGHHDHGEAAEAGHPSAGHGLKMPPPLALLACPFLYLWNFAPHVFAPEKTAGPLDLLLWLADVLMWAILLGLEFIGALIKPFALAIRLFANMIAGHIVLATIVGLILAFRGIAMQVGGGLMVAVGCAALSCLELFVAFLQAYIFVFLTTLFISASVAPEH